MELPTAAFRRLSLTRDALSAELTSAARRLSEHGEILTDIAPLVIKFLLLADEVTGETATPIDWALGIARLRNAEKQAEKVRLSRLSRYVVPPNNIHDYRSLMSMCAGSYGYRMCVFLGVLAPNATGSRASLYPRGSRLIFEKTNGELYVPGYQIVEDPLNRRVLLIIRGSSRLHDAGTDIMCRTATIQTGLPFTGKSDDESCFAHDGMLRAAQRIAEASKPILLASIGENNGIDGIQLTGHSLGAGTATLIHLLWSSDPDMAPLLTSSTVAFGAPSIVSPKLAQALYPVVTSIVCGADVISRIGVPALFDLKRDVLAASRGTPPEAVPPPHSEIPGHPRMHPAGRILLFDPIVQEVERESLEKIRLLDTMFTDHLPQSYMKVLNDCIYVV